MSELNVPGIASELILRLDKWFGPLRQALAESKALGGELDKNLAAAANTAAKALGMTGDEAIDFAKALDAAAKEAEALARANAAIKPPPLPASATSVTNYGAGLRSLAGIAGTVSPALGQMVSGFMAVEGAAAAAGIGLTAALGPIALVVAALATAKAAFSFGFEGVKLAADMEQTSLSFEVMIGSADRATKTLDDLKKFAATTPFEFPEIANAGKQLLAMGIGAEDLTSTLRMLGDVGSGLGQPLGEMAYLFGQIKSQGRAMTQDLNQFAGRGVPIYAELARVLGTTELGVRDLAQEGKIGFAEINAAFQSMTGEGGKFYQMTERQAGTLNGMLSTLSDGWTEIKRQVGEAIIQGLDVKQVVAAVTAGVETLAPIIIGTFSSAVSWIRESWKQGESSRGLVVEMIKLVGNLSEMFEETFGASFLDLLKAALAPALAIQKVIEAIIGTVRDMLKWLNEAIDAVSFLDSDKMHDEMNKNSRGWTKEERENAAKKAQEKSAAASPSAPGRASAGGSAPSGGSASGSSRGTASTPADQEEKERAASIARAKELEWQNFIQTLRMQGLNELADLQDRRHRAENDIARAKTDQEKKQIGVARDIDLEEIRRRNAGMRGEGAPPIAQTAARRTRAYNQSTAPASASSASDGTGPITVNAPAIDLEKLGAVLARNVVPFIDQRIAALDQRTRAEALSRRVKGGL